MQTQNTTKLNIGNLGFGLFLVENDVISSLDNQRVMQGLLETQVPYHMVADTLGILSEDEGINWLSRYTHLKLADHAIISASEEFGSSINSQFLRKNGFIISSFTEEDANCIVYNPFNKEALSALQFHLGKNIKLKLATSSSIKSYYEDQTAAASIPDASLKPLSSDDVTALKHLATEQPIIKFVTRVVEQAVEHKASDIHIEPTSDGFQTRLRIDGILTPYNEGAGLNRAAVVSRVKILAKMDIAERRLPQDSRIRMNIKGKPIDLRVSTVPTLHGENLVLRILNRSVVGLDFEELGYDGTTLDALTSMLKKPNGLILVTGPTGSGKTTTLYTALKSINDGSKKIFTVEDPIEYQLKGISQMATHPAIGLTFANALRSILRQDPDIIMIGEIRDRETADIAIQAALTGHLVVATLHTNSAAASITRLLDMGVQDYLLSTSVLGIVAQRLVRKLCENCSVAEDPGAVQMLLSLYPSLNTLKIPQNMRRAAGCDVCNNTGYLGRSSIYEVASMTRNLQRAISNSPTEDLLDDIAKSDGMISMRAMGLQKVWSGSTTLDEVMRVTST